MKKMYNMNFAQQRHFRMFNITKSDDENVEFYFDKMLRHFKHVRNF